MDDPNITMEEYIWLEEEKAHRRGKVYTLETATYGKIWYNEYVHDLRYVETEFPAIVFNDALTSEVAFSCESTVSPLNNNQIDFRISFDESDDEDYMLILGNGYGVSTSYAVLGFYFESNHRIPEIGLHGFPIFCTGPRRKEIDKCCKSEHDQQAKAKMTLRKLVYEESEEENSDSSRIKDISERLSNESFGMSRTRGLRKKIRQREVSTDSEGEGGSKDPEDHLGSFLAVVEQEEWLMLVWCMMFCQTLSGAVRNWFDYLDPKSTDSIKELSQKFIKEFLKQKRYAKDPMEIHGIKRRMNE
ncbi:hypothetical protein Tco_0812187, partial [Tanacetum coccineum]